MQNYEYINIYRINRYVFTTLYIIIIIIIIIIITLWL
jgi:hypothetical protein